MKRLDTCSWQGNRVSKEERSTTLRTNGRTYTVPVESHENTLSRGSQFNCYGEKSM